MPITMNHDGDIVVTNGTITIDGNSVLTGSINVVDVDSGTYSPTVSGSQSVCLGSVWSPTSVTSDCAQYIRIGSVVNVSGQLTITNGVGNEPASVYITLPSSSIVGNSCQIAGTAVSQCVSSINTPPQIYGRIYGDTTGYTAICEFFDTFSASTTFQMSYHFTYTIV
jgi:hypothetical protein